MGVDTTETNIHQIFYAEKSPSNAVKISVDNPLKHGIVSSSLGWFGAAANISWYKQHCRVIFSFASLNSQRIHSKKEYFD